MTLNVPNSSLKTVEYFLSISPSELHSISLKYLIFPQFSLSCLASLYHIMLLQVLQLKAAKLLPDPNSLPWLTQNWAMTYIVCSELNLSSLQGHV